MHAIRIIIYAFVVKTAKAAMGLMVFAVTESDVCPITIRLGDALTAVGVALLCSSLLAFLDLKPVRRLWVRAFAHAAA